ncbi:hypothetical protein JOE38_001731 [Clavibacter michiganensis]|uniref:DUF2971 domain-containing protein n=1 Tax=Clavibacter michiganensis TaxID=28447 RepID=UPI00195E51F7|nr:DUF2971 domain-containing protein [Clavibacter michiganensis]MBM7411908.1 hypothetical protein [Clavibacter michiganensis]
MTDPTGTNELKLPAPARKSSRELASRGGGKVFAVPVEESTSIPKGVTPGATRTEAASAGHATPSPDELFTENTSSVSEPAGVDDEVETEQDSDKVWVEIPSPPNLKSNSGDIWHYTDAAGLVGILTSNTLRATALTALNDSAEFTHGWELLEDISDAVQKSKWVNPIQKRYVKGILELASELAKDPGLFVLCASEAANSLAQWRAYGNGKGHALLLESGSELAVLGKQDVAFTVDSLQQRWSRVLYREDEQRDFLLRVLGYLAYLTPVPEEHVTRSVEHHRAEAMVVVNAVAHCKEPSFSEEQEVRIIVGAPSVEDIHFRDGATGVTPYLNLTGPGSPSRRSVSDPRTLPVNAIVVGPFVNREASKLGVVSLLRTAGYSDINVEVSQSTLR